LSLVAIAPNLGDQIPKNNFWGVNRNFQHNRQNIKTCIMKTTATIPTKFCKVIKITKYTSWVVQTRENKYNMADGRYFEKSKNRRISARVGPIGTKFLKSTP